MKGSFAKIAALLVRIELKVRSLDEKDRLEQFGLKLDNVLLLTSCSSCSGGSFRDLSSNWLRLARLAT